MSVRSKVHLLLLALFVFCTVVGCDNPNGTGENGTEENGEGNGNGGGHGAHIHGPHDGPVAKLTPEDYSVEWLSEGETLIVYILNTEGTEEVPIEASEVVISTKLEDATPIERVLPAANAEGDPAKASRFELKDQALVTDVIELEAHTEITIKVGDKEYKAHLEHHDH